MGQGWHEEQAAFCETEYPRLLGALVLFLRDRDLAEELAQEALMRACTHWRRVRRMAAPGAWAHRVAINLGKSSITKRERGKRALSTLRIEDLGRNPDPADVAAVKEAIDELPARQRAAVVLRYYCDFSVRDSATILGCREGTVRALTHQGLQRLREATGVDEPDEVPDAV